MNLRLGRAVIVFLIAIPALFLAFYGVRGGMPWDFSLVYVSESTPGLAGFLYGSDPLRIYTNIFYNVGYLLPGMVHAQGSWVGYHLIYAILWSTKGVLVLWLCYLFGLRLAVAAPAAVIAVAHGSDLSIGHVGQINQFGIVVWTLLSMCCFVSFLQHKGFGRYVLLLIAIVSSYLGLWSYEGTLFGLLAYPILFIWVTGCWREWPANVGAALLTGPPVVYSILMANRLIVQRSGGSYQESVMRSDIRDVGALARDYVHLLQGLFDVTAWLPDKLEAFNVSVASLMTWQFLAAALLSLLVTTYFCVVLATTLQRTEKAEASVGLFRSEVPRPTLLRLVATLFILVSAFLAPFLALEAGGGFWRTQILAGPFASILMAMVLYFLTIYLARRVAHSIVARSAAYSCALLAIAMSGFAANAVGYGVYNAQWQEIRAPIERLLEAVPSVKPGTIIMLQDVPVKFIQSWGSNFWFDMLVRLAYPRTQVAGSYTFDLARATPEDIQGIIDSGGGILQLQNGRKVLITHGHDYVIKGDRVGLEKSYLPTLVASAGIESAIVLQWRNSGPFKIIRNAEDIEMAVNPNKDRYSPDACINPAGLSDIAQRRFFE
jgi:hypothetical protein